MSAAIRSNIPRRSSRLAAKSSQPMEDVVRVKYTHQTSEKPVVAPAAQPIKKPMPASSNKPDFFEKSPNKPAVCTAEEHRKYCKPCEKQFLVREMQDYLNRISNLRASDTKVQLMIDLFNLIEEKMAFMFSSDFSDNDRFVNVVHMKSIELQDQLKNAEISEQTRQAASTLLMRVHKKIHLYLIKNEVHDEIYNEFLEKFVKQF